MTAYKIIMGFAMIFICMILWIVLNEVMVNTGAIFNAMNVTSDVIERNTIAISLFYYILFFIVIAFGIWIIKSTIKKNNMEGYD